MFNILYLAIYLLSCFVNASTINELKALDPIYDRYQTMKNRQIGLLNSFYDECKYLIEKEEFGNLKYLCWKISKLKSHKNFNAKGLKLENALLQRIPNLDQKYKDILSSIVAISFIMPVYNREQTVSESIDAVYAQGFSGCDYEFIVVDDGSNDSTMDILKQYEEKYNNFFIVKNKQNLGAPQTRNVGILHARSKYICNIDSDDVWPNGILELFNKMKSKNSQMAFVGNVKFFSDFDRNSITSTYLHDNSACELDYRNAFGKAHMVLACGNRIFEKKAWKWVGGFLEMRGNDTASFSYLMLLRGFKVYVDPDLFYYHRTWSNGNDVYCIDCNENVNDVSPKMVLELNKGLISNYSSIIRGAYLKNYFIQFAYSKNRIKLDKLASKYIQLIQFAYNKDYSGLESSKRFIKAIGLNNKKSKCMYLYSKVDD